MELQVFNSEELGSARTTTVNAEVLPVIRKNGMCGVDEMLKGPALTVATLAYLKQESDKRKQLECQMRKRCSQMQVITI